MSLLSVLFGRKSNDDHGQSAAAQAAPERIGQPHDAAKSAAPAGSVARSDGKTGVDAERADRRERLYRVVREALMRCGVLSASYKFKVLSTDARGLQFLVMLDVASDTAQLMRFTEMEASIRQAAKDQYDIDVIAVYSRVNPQLAPRASQLQAAAHPKPTHLQPAFRAPAAPAANSANSNRHAAAFGLGQSSMSSAHAAASLAARAGETLQQPTTLRPAEFGHGKSPAPDGGFEPIHADEVNALKHALAAKNAPAPADGVLRRSGARLKSATDFEDTQVFASNRSRPDLGLSATQYGDLQ